MPTETIILIKPHTHGGVSYAPGSTLALDAATCAWLVERGVAKAAPAAATTTKPRRDAARPTR